MHFFIKLILFIFYEQKKIETKEKIKQIKSFFFVSII